jgi:hypothetical protein
MRCVEQSQRQRGDLVGVSIFILVLGAQVGNGQPALESSMHGSLYRICAATRRYVIAS